MLPLTFKRKSFSPRLALSYLAHRADVYSLERPVAENVTRTSCWATCVVP
jgi:hypothetical protein